MEKELDKEKLISKLFNVQGEIDKIKESLLAKEENTSTLSARLEELQEKENELNFRIAGINFQPNDLVNPIIKFIKKIQYPDYVADRGEEIERLNEERVEFEKMLLNAKSENEKEFYSKEMHELEDRIRKYYL